MRNSGGGGRSTVSINPPVVFRVQKYLLNKKSDGKKFFKFNKSMCASKIWHIVVII